MELKLRLMDIAEKPVLAQLMELYQYEFTPFTGADISQHGYYGYRHLDDYWNEEGRFPYLLLANGQIAGFALVCGYCETGAAPGTHAVGEFFVLRKYRRLGLGEQAAATLFRSHPGGWELGYQKQNTQAAAFWRRVTACLQETGAIRHLRRWGNEDGSRAGWLFESTAQESQMA